MKVGIDAELSRIEIVMKRDNSTISTTETINVYQARLLSESLKELADVLERAEQQADSKQILRDEGEAG